MRSAALADQLLPPIVARGDRPLVVVPTGVLHGVPWAALAPLRGRPVSVSPSLSAWAAAAAAPSVGIVAPLRSIAGPGLRFADEEVAALAGIHEGRRGRPGGRVERCGHDRARSAVADSSTSPATARSAPTTRCSRRSRWPTVR